MEFIFILAVIVLQLCEAADGFSLQFFLKYYFAYFITVRYFGEGRRKWRVS